MEVGIAEAVMAILSGSAGMVLGAAGGAYGATAALKKELQTEKDVRRDADTNLSLRTDRLEQRVGLTSDGSLTGNGLITTTRALADAIVDLQTRE